MVKNAIKLKKCEKKHRKSRVAQRIDKFHGDCGYLREGVEWLRSKTAERVAGVSRSHGRPDLLKLKMRKEKLRKPGAIF